MNNTNNHNESSTIVTMCTIYSKIAHQSGQTVVSQSSWQQSYGLWKHYTHWYDCAFT